MPRAVMLAVLFWRIEPGHGHDLGNNRAREHSRLQLLVRGARRIERSRAKARSLHGNLRTRWDGTAMKMLQGRFLHRSACRPQPCHGRSNGESDFIRKAYFHRLRYRIYMMNSNTQRPHPGDCKADADVSDEYIWSEISYLDPEQQNGPSNALPWVTTVAALLLWGLLLFMFHSS
jgi:hypothetical protein